MAYVYILANWNNTALYIGVTNDLIRRLYEHKGGFVDSFSRRYRTHKLVYYEETSDMFAAIEREKYLKKIRRERKNLLINNFNPHWLDLSEEWKK